MILVVGGMSSGRRSYVRSLGFADADMSGDAHDGAPVLVDAQELVRAGDSDASSLAAAIALRKKVVICQEVGSGVVPLERAEREWRDRAGALAKELASRADAVVRMTCGIPQALKGDLPRDEVEVVIMRHGSTEANERHAYAGSTDVALSEGGRAEASAAGVCPQVPEVIVSPLLRARQTAEICFPEAKLVAVDGLREMDFGDFEGKSAADMAEDADYRAWVDGRCEGPCPNGEGRADLERRVASALEAVVREAMQRGERRVVVVGHGGTVMAAMDALSHEGKGYFEWQVGNCEGYRCRARFRDGALVLDRPLRFENLSFMEGTASEANSTAPAVNSTAPEAGSDESAGQARHPQPGSSFFANRSCEYFPCHEGIDERDFNCLFCYCPLYALGPDCGGNFTYTERGTKNCKDCAIPHVRENGVKLVLERFAKLAALAARP